MICGDEEFKDDPIQKIGYTMEVMRSIGKLQEWKPFLDFFFFFFSFFHFPPHNQMKPLALEIIFFTNITCYVTPHHVF